MTATLPLLEIRGLTRRFGGLTAVDDVDLDVAQGEFVSIIGPNGAGKTTLFNLVTGLDEPDAGTVRLDGRDITRLAAERLAALGMARTFQHGRVFANLSVLDNVLVGAHVRFKAVRPSWPGPLVLLEPLAELALALVRPAAVGAEEKRAARRGAGDPRAASATGCCRARTIRPTACPTPTGAGSRSPARWRSVPACCCSTSRPPA